jgi:C-methyltransferase
MARSAPAASTAARTARSTGILLDALAVLGLVVRSEASYELAPLARGFLLPGGPTYLGDLSNIFSGPLLWDAFGKLTEAVRAGGSVMEKHAEAPSHPFWETFAKSSAAFAFPSGEALASHLAPMTKGSKPVRVLDVAAGSGIYGYTLLRSPNVEVTFLDWPNVLPETRAWGERLGADMSRARFLPGSLFEVDLGGPYDVVLASHLFHHFDRKTCQSLTQRLAGALAPGGRLAVNDFVTGAAIENPGATMFSLIMLVWTRSGESDAERDPAGWISEAGLGRPSAHPLPGTPTTWLTAERR